MGPIHTFDEFLSLMRRRAGLILAITLVIALASVFFALSLPHQYSSSEVIQVEQPRIADDLVPSTVEGSSARRLQLIEQQLMSRDSILDVIAQLDVFQGLSGLSDTEQVIIFRESVSLDGVAAAREGAVDDGTVSALTITANFGTPEMAQAVAHELAVRTIELSARERRAQALATLEFFRTEEAALVEAITTLEAEILRFRTSNQVATESQLDILRSDIAAVNEALLNVSTSQIAVRRELEGLQTEISRPATERRAEVLTRQIAALDDQKAFLQQQAESLRSAIEGTPEFESRAEIYETRLQRYRSQLETVAAHRTDAEIGFRLEDNSQAERLTVIEPAPLPEYPLNSSRKKVAGAGTFAGLVLAIALAFVLDLRTPVIRSSAQMQRELGITPAVVIPMHQPKSNRSKWLALFKSVKPPAFLG